MNTSGAVAWYFIILIIVFILTYAGLKIAWPSALALSVLVALIVMNTLAIPDVAFGGQDGSMWLYGFLNFVSLVILLIYVIVKSLTDKRA